MRNYYSNGISNKKYGAITGVVVRKEGKDAFKIKFYEEDMDYLTPNGFIYTILAAFRGLLIINACIIGKKILLKLWIKLVLN